MSRPGYRATSPSLKRRRACRMADSTALSPLKGGLMAVSTFCRNTTGALMSASSSEGSPGRTGRRPCCRSRSSAMGLAGASSAANSAHRQSCSMAWAKSWVSSNCRDSSSRPYMPVMHSSLPEAALRTSLTRTGSPSRASSSRVRRWSKDAAASSSSPLRRVMIRSPRR